jgi:hypothetical protein
MYFFIEIHRRKCIKKKTRICGKGIFTEKTRPETGRAGYFTPKGRESGRPASVQPCAQADSGESPEGVFFSRLPLNSVLGNYQFLTLHYHNNCFNN